MKDNSHVCIMTAEAFRMITEYGAEHPAEIQNLLAFYEEIGAVRYVIPDEAEPINLDGEEVQVVRPEEEPEEQPSALQPAVEKVKKALGDFGESIIEIFRND
jgi:hypothetical protein